MNLDEIQSIWNTQEKALATSIQLNQKILHQITLKRARGALQWSALSQAFGAAPTLIVISMLGRFAFNHFTEPRYWIPAALLDIYVIGYLALQVQVIALTLRIDYSQPVIGIQRRIEEIRIARVNFKQWFFLSMTFVCIPIVIVTFKGLFRLDAVRQFGWHWIAWDVLFGLTVIPLVRWLFKRFSGASNNSFIRQLMRDIAGYNLMRANEFLDRLSSFDSERE